MGNWLKTHMPCPDTEGCGSSDGAAMSADDGSIHCFACGQHFLSKDRKPVPMDTTEQIQPPLPAGSHKQLTERAIGQSTCQLYGYETGLHHGRPAHFAQIKGQDGSNVATHIRVLPKQISWKGSPKGTQLFGQHLGTGN